MRHSDSNSNSDTHCYCHSDCYSYPHCNGNTYSATHANAKIRANTEAAPHAASQVVICSSDVFVAMMSCGRRVSMDSNIPLDKIAVLD